ncbi:MAG: PP2C family protein-serine/threonine phosphatase [Planctomycetota bacterium]
MHKLSCGAVWGGIDNRDADLEAAGIRASLFARSAQGGRGGDAHYVSVCEGDLLTRMVVADVVGHGETVSDVSSWLYDVLCERMNDPDGAAILSELNGRAYAKGMSAMATAVIVGYYRTTHELSYASAGHPAIYLWSAGDASWKALSMNIEADGPADLPFAVLKNPVFHQISVPMKAGDRVCLYSDGILEGPSPSGEQFGAKKLEKVLNANTGSKLPEIKKEIVRALDEHTAGRFDHDDVTLLLAEVI